MLHMIIEQTHQYPVKMEYHPETKQFFQMEYRTLLFERGVSYPYGWIKESGTPPLPHWDCILIDLSLN